MKIGQILGTTFGAAGLGVAGAAAGLYLGVDFDELGSVFDSVADKLAEAPGFDSKIAEAGVDAISDIVEKHPKFLEATFKAGGTGKDIAASIPNALPALTNEVSASLSQNEIAGYNLFRDNFATLRPAMIKLAEEAHGAVLPTILSGGVGAIGGGIIGYKVTDDSSPAPQPHSEYPENHWQEYESVRRNQPRPVTQRT